MFDLQNNNNVREFVHVILVLESHPPQEVVPNRPALSFDAVTAAAQP